MESRFLSVFFLVVLLSVSGAFMACGPAVGVRTGTDGRRVTSVLIWNEPKGIIASGFGVEGVVRWDSGEGNEAGSSLALSPDGRILVAGILRVKDRNRAVTSNEVFLAKFNGDGTFDADFGVDGIARWESDRGYLNNVSLALLSDGAILVAGTQYISGRGPDTKSDLFLLRFDAGGSFDASFGAGGVVKWDGGHGENFLRAITIQPDDKILLAGGLKIWTDRRVKLESVLLRYDTDGNLDDTFKNGIAQRHEGMGPDIGSAVALQSDGKILVAGRYYNSNHNYDMGLARFHVDGSPDIDFGKGGSVIWDNKGKHEGTCALMLLPEGNILVGGSNGRHKDNRVFLLRFESDGTPDVDFGVSGVVTWESGQSNDHCDGVAVQPDGRILVTGIGYDASGYKGTPFLTRFDTEGNVDKSFGSDGTVTWSTSGNEMENEYRYRSISAKIPINPVRQNA
jgi:uncharacterized delta-60 repeat protein